MGLGLKVTGREAQSDCWFKLILGQDGASQECRGDDANESIDSSKNASKKKWPKKYYVCIRSEDKRRAEKHARTTNRASNTARHECLARLTNENEGRVTMHKKQYRTREDRRVKRHEKDEKRG